MSETNFIDPNKKSKWGQSDVQMWMGVVVSFDAQKDQIEKGYGWKYRVRILGDHAVNESENKDEDFDYATCILPTTAGTGAAFKLRSVRISQGDTVFGLRGGGVGGPALF